MSIGTQWYTKGTRQTKIGQLEVTLLVDEEILGLQIAVEHSVSVAVSDTLAELAHEFLDHLRAQSQ